MHQQRGSHTSQSAQTHSHAEIHSRQYRREFTKVQNIAYMKGGFQYWHGCNRDFDKSRRKTIDMPFIGFDRPASISQSTKQQLPVCFFFRAKPGCHKVIGTSQWPKIGWQRRGIILITALAEDPQYRIGKAVARASKPDRFGLLKSQLARPRWPPGERSVRHAYFTSRAMTVAQPPCWQTQSARISAASCQWGDHSTGPAVVNVSYGDR